MPLGKGLATARVEEGEIEWCISFDRAQDVIPLLLGLEFPGKMVAIRAYHLRIKCHVRLVVRLLRSSMVLGANPQTAWMLLPTGRFNQLALASGGYGQSSNFPGF